MAFISSADHRKTHPQRVKTPRERALRKNRNNNVARSSPVTPVPQTRIAEPKQRHCSNLSGLPKWLQKAFCSNLSCIHHDVEKIDQKSVKTAFKSIHGVKDPPVRINTVDGDLAIRASHPDCKRPIVITVGEAVAAVLAYREQIAAARSPVA